MWPRKAILVPGKTLCRDLRKNIPLRMMMAASFASVLLEPLKVLPFVLHLWGTTGNRKDSSAHGGNVHLGQSQNGRPGKDHEHDKERHFAQCRIFMQYPFCRR